MTRFRLYFSLLPWLLPTIFFAQSPCTDSVEIQIIDCNTVNRSFKVFGSANFDCSNSVLCLTADEPHQIGGAIYWDTSNMQVSSRELSLIDGFVLDLRASFGSSDAGSHGFVLVLGKDTSALIPCGAGGLLGYDSIPGTIAFEFDTHRNPEPFLYDTVDFDHVSLLRESIRNMPIRGPVSILHPGRGEESVDVEDTDPQNNTLPYEIRVQYDPDLQLLELFVNNEQRIAHQIDLINELDSTHTYIATFATTGAVPSQVKLTAINLEEHPRPFQNCNDFENLNYWLTANNSDYGSWQNQTNIEGRFTQLYNLDPTQFLSPYLTADAEIECLVTVNDEGEDNDHIGIVWGVQDSFPFAQFQDQYSGYMFSWRREPQERCSTQIAPEGLALIKLNGFIANDRDCDIGGSPFWSHYNLPEFQILDSTQTPGIGWELGVQYKIRVRQNSEGFEIWVTEHDSGDSIYHHQINTVLQPGRIGFYTNSQGNAEFSRFKHEFQPVFTVSENRPCTGDEITFTYATENTFLPQIIETMYWDFGDSTPHVPALSDGVVLSANHRYTIPGSYTARLVVRPFTGCEESFDRVIQVLPLPSVSLGPDTTLCPGELLLVAPDFSGSDFTWSTGDSLPTLLIGTPGTYSVTVTTDGCKGSDTLSVAYAIPIEYTVELEADCYTVGEGQATVNFESGASPLTAVLDDGTAGPVFTNLSAQSYTFSVADRHNCSVAGEFIIQSSSNPDILLETDSVSCFGAMDGGTTIISNTAPLEILYLNDTFWEVAFIPDLPAGNYTFEIIDSLACRWPGYFEIFGPPLLEIILPSDTTIRFGQHLELLARMNYGTYNSAVWSPSTDLLINDTLALLALPKESRTYSLEVSNDQGCFASASIAVNVDKENGVFLPNAFSPNGDGINDEFFVHAGAVRPGVANIEHLTIFNRWGDLVFNRRNTRPDNPLDGWDGTFRGRPAVSGIYIYHLRWLGVDGEVRDKTGDVLLIR